MTRRPASPLDLSDRDFERYAKAERYVRICQRQEEALANIRAVLGPADDLSERERWVPERAEWGLASEIPSDLPDDEKEAV